MARVLVGRRKSLGMRWCAGRTLPGTNLEVKKLKNPIGVEEHGPSKGPSDSAIHLHVSPGSVTV